MKEMLGTLAAWIIPLLFGIVWVLYVVRIVKNIYMPVKKVKAVLVEKYSYTPVSKNTAAFNTDSYVLVFEAEGKRLSFHVSEFSYGGYKVKKKGTLTYKGDKIIRFR